MTFSATVSVGSSWKNWKTNPMLRPRHDASSLCERLWMFAPPMLSEPDDGRSMPPIMFSSVDLPLPDLPTMATNSPAVISRSMLRSALNAPAGVS